MLSDANGVNLHHQHFSLCIFIKLVSTEVLNLAVWHLPLKIAEQAWSISVCEPLLYTKSSCQGLPVPEANENPWLGNEDFLKRCTNISYMLLWHFLFCMRYHSFL